VGLFRRAEFRQGDHATRWADSNRKRSASCKGEYARVYVFTTVPKSGALYEPVSQRLLPLDAQMATKVWPRSPGRPGTCPSHGRRHCDFARTHPRVFFISTLPCVPPNLSRARTPSRLAAMHVPTRTSTSCWSKLKGTFHRLRQRSIDEELFDVIAGFEALSRKKTHRL